MLNCEAQFRTSAKPACCHSTARVGGSHGKTGWTGVLASLLQISYSLTSLKGAYGEYYRGL